MATPPVLPIAHALAHGVAGCIIVVGVAILWAWMPGARDSALALATVSAIGAMAWTGALLVARPGAPNRAANDNHPFDPLILTWTPIADPEATAQTLLR